MKKLTILALLCMPLFSNSQLQVKNDTIVQHKEEKDTIRIKLQSDISELIRVNEESKELSKETNEKLSQIVKLVRNKVKNESNKEF